QHTLGSHGLGHERAFPDEEQVTVAAASRRRSVYGTGAIRRHAASLLGIERPEKDPGVQFRREMCIQEAPAIGKERGKAVAPTGNLRDGNRHASRGSNAAEAGRAAWAK